MDFLNPFAVAQRLRENSLSERDKFKYLIASIIIRALADVPSRILGSREQPALAFLGAIFIIVVYLVGLRFCFAANARGDNQRFVERWLCLSASILVWTALLPTYLALIAYLLYPTIAQTYSVLYILFALFIGAASGLGLILYFVLLTHLIAIAASGQSTDHESNLAPIAAP